jgi:hypothetical protein
MNRAHCICDEMPHVLMHGKVPVYGLFVDQNYDMNKSNAIFVSPEIGLFPFFFSMYFRTTTLFDTLQRMKNV